MSPTETTPFGTPVLVTLRGRAPVNGKLVTVKPDGRAGVEIGVGYRYFDSDRVQLDETPRQPRRR